MPLALPNLDNRRFQQLVDETLARVPVHTPEWTNFGKADPGVTLVELFAFLTENLIYRANQIPERNRLKFLKLLDVPLQPAAAARGLVTINNDRGPLENVVLDAGLELRAGAVSFRTELGLDVLPVETRIYFKRAVAAPPAALVEYYRLLYASYDADIPADMTLYETIAQDGRAIESVDLGSDAVDRSLWIALFARKNDALADARKKLGGRVLTLGIVPAVDDISAQLVPGGQSGAQTATLLAFEVPNVPDNGKVPFDAQGRPAPTYRALEPRTDVDLLAQPGIVQLTLPPETELTLWQDLDPLEAGVGDLPPALTDDALADRLITWVRIRATAAARARILWTDINTTWVRQRAQVLTEPLADGTGQPDQVRKLARAPVLPASISVGSFLGSERTDWSEIDDLFAAGPEVAVQDPRLPPGCNPPALSPTDVFAADPEAGEIRFGDGFHGRRLPDGAKVYASYDYCEGAVGNVGRGSINGGPQLPSGFSVTNPVRTWGGADAEEVAVGEKQIKRYLQHRDRLVTQEDYEAIVYRAPGVDVGRVDVLPAFHPDLVPNEPGSAPGVVTLMVIPRQDPGQPDAPRPDRLFLDTLCRYLDPRRLVTTELCVRGAVYKPLWISVGIDVVAGKAVAEVVEAVKSRLREFLAPVRSAGLPDQTIRLFSPQSVDWERGWPLRTPVSARVLVAETSRVSGVSSVADVEIAEGNRASVPVVEMQGLELPRVIGISVVAGDPIPIALLRGDTAAQSVTPSPPSLPIPIIPESC